jgi:hypothetical protein
MTGVGGSIRDVQHAFESLTMPAEPSEMATRERRMKGVVLTYSCTSQNPRGHEFLTRAELAARLAALKGYGFAGEYDPAARYDGHVYLVPSDTLSEDTARQLGVKNKDDLFGGVVPYPFLATKAITHGLPEKNATAPTGWSSDLSHLISEQVLPGFTAFCADDARTAGVALLKLGTIRLKKTSGIGGLGQWVLSSEEELLALLEKMDPDELRRDGIALEANLSDVVTCSVGQTFVDGLVASYTGTQRLTMDHHGQEVYGGSRLLVARGGYDKLLALDLHDNLRVAIRQACAYHSAVCQLYPRFFASRCNYDVAQGIDDQGRWHSGVLEQSWRLGGASAAELAALDAFKQDPGLHAVNASTEEVYEQPAVLPPGATVHYQGEHGAAGALTKYSWIERYANT